MEKFNNQLLTVDDKESFHVCSCRVRRALGGHKQLSSFISLQLFSTKKYVITFALISLCIFGVFVLPLVVQAHPITKAVLGPRDIALSKASEKELNPHWTKGFISIVYENLIFVTTPSFFQGFFALQIDPFCHICRILVRVRICVGSCIIDSPRHLYQPPKKRWLFNDLVVAGIFFWGWRSVAIHIFDQAYRIHSTEIELLSTAAAFCFSCHSPFQFTQTNKLD